MSFNCCCCFDINLSNEHVGRCNADHVICKGCVYRGIKNAIGEMREFKCPDNSICNNIISEPTIQACVADTNLKRAYFNICTHNALRGIQDIQQCAFCEYAVILEANETVFHCITCDKLYCVACKRVAHENGCLTDIDHETERQISAISIRCCSYPPIIKIDACNHVICLCGTEWCWYCKGTRSKNRSGVHRCLDNCPTYVDPRGFTIDVTQEQADNSARVERTRTSILRDLNISINASHVQQAESRRQELQLSEQLSSLYLNNVQQIRETVEITNQKLYTDSLNKHHIKALRIQQDILYHITRVAAIKHSRKVNTNIRGLLTERTNLLEKLINL